MYSYIIEREKSIEFFNVVSCRQKCNFHSVNDNLISFVSNLKNSGLKRNGPLISVTHAVDIVSDETQIVDIEFLVPVIGKVESNLFQYRYLPKFYLGNCIYLRYYDSPEEIYLAYNEITRYIQENHLHQIAPFYNINQENELTKELYIDVYAPLNPNCT
ncbi:hypothetical protein [Paenibacillus amylolyticus]|uniref:hypothetical protein n=1 Tax=Paenibacillus amylolyticus TaxID=1451 RepID=UPI003EBA9573